jgi:hypothetical protein
MIFSGIKQVFPPQMLDELIFVPEVVWTYLWQITFFFPEILKVPLGTGLLKSKKKIYGWLRKKNVLHTTASEERGGACFFSPAGERETERAPAAAATASTGQWQQQQQPEGLK